MPSEMLTPHTDYSLPSVAMSIDIIENYDSDIPELIDAPVEEDISDAPSILSDDPSPFLDSMEDPMNVDSDDFDMSWSEARGGSRQPLPQKRKACPRCPAISPAFIDDLDVGSSQPSPAKYRVVQISPFEGAPSEVVQRIGADLETDGDLCSLMLTCKTLATILIPENSEVWRHRFLARYDHPVITGPFEYCSAYRHRRFVLRTIRGFECAGDEGTTDEKAQIQLEVLLDMVLETYHKKRLYHPPQIHSRNLAAFCSPGNSPWMLAFLKSHLYAQTALGCYGKSHPLFDTLQVLLSHLLLSFASPMILFVNSDRSDYDLTRVYNWDQPFNTLLTRFPDEEPELERPSLIFPNLRSPSPIPQTRCELDMHTLLHIRNFWYHHMLNDHKDRNEHSYVRMAKQLTARGWTPRKWENPLQEPTKLGEKWVGHYSCMHPWPKDKAKLDETQTCATDWSEVDPLTLDFAASTDNAISGHWPAVFASLPAFSTTVLTADYFDTVPDPETGETVPHPAPYKYIRGLAPFLSMNGRDPKKMARKPKSKPERKPSRRNGNGKAKKKINYDDGTDDGDSEDDDDIHTLSNSDDDSLPAPRTSQNRKPTQKYHPYLALRLRGIIHPIPSSLTAQIPGFQRIIMILYKPTTRYLIQVLEHAAEDYGNPFEQLLPGAAAAAQETENALLGILKEKMEDAERNATGVRAQECECGFWTTTKIAELEDAFIPPAHLDWADIEYAYAYEGVIIPGGMIMLGRWWRCASVAGGGVGEGGGGEVVEVLPDRVDEVTGNPVVGWSRERGPFVFWC